MESVCLRLTRARQGHREFLTDIHATERPLRDHELLQECIEAWGVETNASLFLVKKIPTPKDLPATSEEYGAWVQMEVKRNKWSKRWLLLKGQNIYVGKSEKVGCEQCRVAAIGRA